MTYFFSALVIDSGPRDPIQLVSLALVNEAGDEYYAESGEWNILLAPEGMRADICASIDQIAPKLLRTIAREVEAFVAHRFPVFWGYHGALEFTALYQLFGHQALPPTWPFYCHELAVELERDGNPRPPRMDEMQQEHHALPNARWVRETCLWLREWKSAQNTAKKSEEKKDADGGEDHAHLLREDSTGA